VLYLHAEGLRSPRGSVVARDADPPTLAIESVGITERIHEAVGPRRYTQERRYARALELRVAGYRPTVVIGATGALTIQAAAQRAARAGGARFIYWLQDVQSAAISRLLGGRSAIVGRLAGAVAEHVERRLLREADVVVSITPDFVPVLERWGVQAARIALIPNWAPLEELSYAPELSDWAARRGVTTRPIFLYAGTLGRKHDPSLLLGLAASLPDASVIVISEGTGTDWLKRQPLPPNLRLWPPQPPDDISTLLATADVLVALLSQDAGVFSVPSKVLTYLAAGRPILAAMPANNQAAEVIREANAGVVTDPGDRTAFLQAAGLLAQDPGSREAAGKAARRYAERSFDIEGVTDRFEELLGDGMNR
jgi:glycosyltransferase involved in cell wall biosynthesis